MAVVNRRFKIGWIMALSVTVLAGTLVCAEAYQASTGAIQSTSAVGPAVTVRLVAKNAFSFGPDEATVLPTSDVTAFAAGTIFYVEVWAQTTHATGLASVSLDVRFSADEVISTESNTFPFTGGVSHGFLFQSLTGGTADNVDGIVDDVTGSYLPAVGCASASVGVAPDGWARVAIVEMLAVVSGSPIISALGTGNPVFGTAVCGSGNLPDSSIMYVAINAPTSLKGDCTADGNVDLADFVSMTTCLAGPGNTASAGCSCVDFNDDGRIDLGDLRAFQEVFNGP